MDDNSLLIKIKADTDKATKEINKLNKEVGSLTKQVGKNNKTLKSNEKAFGSVSKATSSFNKQLTGLLATYLSFQGARQLITTTSEIESGFIGIAKTTGLTGKAFAELENELLDMSTTMAGVELSGLQSVAETAGQLGITGKENILEFTRVISMMGTATDLSAEEAATAMAKLGNSLGIPVKEFERLGSVINELSNNTTATAKDLVDMGQRISGMGKTFGLTGDEVLAFAATLKDVGMSAELGGTAISKVMLEMLKDTKAFAKASGVSFDEFSKMLKDEPVKALELFIKELGKLDKAAKVEALDELGLKSSGVTQTMLKLADNTEILSKNLKIASDEWTTNTSLLKEFEVASKGLDAQWIKLKNNFIVLAWKIGKELLPMMKDLINETVKWVDALDDDAIKRFGEGIGKIADAVLGIGKTLLWLNDIIIPDVLGGKDAGLLDTAGAGWSRIGKHLSDVESTYSALSGLESQIVDIGAIEAAVNSYDGLAGTYDTLSVKLQNLLADNQKYQQLLAGDKTRAATNATAELAVQQEKIMQLSQTLASQRPFDATTASANTAATAVAATSAKVQELKQLTLNGMTVMVDADTTPASFAIDKYIKDERGIIIGVTTEWKDAEKELDKLRNTEEKDAVEVPVEADGSGFKKDVDSLKTDVSKTDAVVDVDADTSSAEKKIDKIKQPTDSKHTVNDNVPKVLSAIDRLKVTTHSTHVVHIKEVRAAAEGGLMPQRLAVGGIYRGSGSVPGYDASDSDKVNAYLTGGEYVIKRSAVDAIGVATLNAINSFKMPKIPGYAEGGLVGGSSSVSTSPVLAPINLNIGGQSFGVMGDREVAEALQRYFNSEGGL